MTKPVKLAELWRNGFLESEHLGHVAIIGPDGDLTGAWGDADAEIFPRSSCKMVQALPLVESGAAKRYGLGTRQLALACASHSGADIHTLAVEDWLTAIDRSADDLRCGAHPPSDKDARNTLIRKGSSPCQIHNNCSGKHTGFLTFAAHIGAGPEYVEIDHPVQKAVREGFEDVTGMTSPGYGIDGCSAPNFRTTLSGLARAMQRFAAAESGGSARETAMVALREAMVSHPELVAGEGRACTDLMRAAKGQAAVKTGAEGVYIAIIPGLKTGVALKISDGATRASEAVMAALLVKFGVIDKGDPAALRYMDAPQVNWRGIDTGTFRVSSEVA